MARRVEGGPFVMRTYAMLTSPAWQLLGRWEKELLEALEVEHMAHGGTMNGELTVPFSQLKSRIKKPENIGFAGENCEALGFVKVARHGSKELHGSRAPNRYRLTYVEGRREKGGKKPVPASNDWAKLADDAAAQRALDRAAEARRQRRATGQAINPPRDIDSSSLREPKKQA